MALEDVSPEHGNVGGLEELPDYEISAEDLRGIDEEVEEVRKSQRHLNGLLERVDRYSLIGAFMGMGTAIVGVAAKELPIMASGMAFAFGSMFPVYLLKITSRNLYDSNN